MVRKHRLRKWLIGLAVVLVLVPLVAMGAVNYMGRKYAKQIDNMLSSLLEPEIPDLELITDMPDEENPATATTEPQGQTTSPAPSPPAAATVEVSGAVSTPPETSVTPEQKPGETAATGTTTTPDKQVVKPPAGIAASDQTTALAIFDKMSMAEKISVVQTVTKFSTGELLEYYKLYKQGDKETIKAKLRAKLTADDYEKIRQLAGKYR